MRFGRMCAPYSGPLLTAALTLCAAPAFAFEPPPRQPAFFTPPAAVTLASPERAARAPLAEPFLREDAPALVAWLDARPRALPAPPDDLDLGWGVLNEHRRAIAQSLKDWAETRTVSAERRRMRAALAQAYATRDYEPFWITPAGEWTAATAPTLARLAKAGDDGLDLRDYEMPAQDRATPRLADELSLSEAVAAYAMQARGGRLAPESISGLIGAVPTLIGSGEAVAEVARATDAGATLQGFNPPHYGYQQLREKLIELRSQRVVAVPGDQRVVEAVASVASDAAPSHGKRRRASEPAPSAARIEAEIIANMERWRWLPRDLGDPRIEVNIPDFELALVRDNQVAHRTRVIVGKESTPTPIFSDEMEEIIVNPSWYVPESIVKKEWGGNVGAGYQVSMRRGKMVVRQPPGERNALGRVKFVFPNDYAVYMHDTPQRGLFSATHRAFSHGCMRVQEPFALAEAVLGPDSGWTEARVKKMIGPAERYITLEKKLPVHIEYFTAYVDEAGQLVQRPDLYGYSARVRRALGLGG